MSTPKLTPLMQQYMDIKKEYPNALLFFQVGDFYELFFDDAKKAASFLAIALTKRGKCDGEDIPLCGVPVHALRHYLIKLVKGGFCVALCDQLSEPKPGTIVERGVTQVITPGTLTDDAMLDQKSASYILSFVEHDEQWGLLFGELLTAQLFATTIPAGNYRSLEAELSRFFPDEIITPVVVNDRQAAALFKQLGYWVTPYGGKENDYSFESLKNRLGVQAVSTLQQHYSLQQSITQFFSYLAKIQHQAIDEFKNVQFYQPDDYLMLDAATQRNLELVKNTRDGGRTNTLLSVIDRAQTPMGSRMVRKWLLRPLVQMQAIHERLAAVEAINRSGSLREELAELLRDVGDLERVVGRIALYRASCADYIHLRRALEKIPNLVQLLSAHHQAALLNHIAHTLIDTRALVALLAQSLNDDADLSYIIRPGFDAELDRLRELLTSGEQKILALEAQEIAATGIQSLKIKYNKISGYAIEITKTHKQSIPAYYIHQQSLSNRERFVIPALIALEKDINDAQGGALQLEEAIFERIKQSVREYLVHLRQIAYALAYLDGLYSFAITAYDNGYVAPAFHEAGDINIDQGRHPVVEQSLNAPFIANDTQLTQEQSLHIITGPNMGGKSTYLRQVAHIAILAQCGSFVPAQRAKLPILDRIFTRIGSGDNLAEGKSTFFVEMEETALITKQATARSLVILDEVGRGTSTYDGLAIAQAVVEYIAVTIGARCLFATHYHELTLLEKQYPVIANYHMLCEQGSSGVIFLHKLARGAAAQSFGLEVARLAQLPQTVIDRASAILQKLQVTSARSDQSVALKHYAEKPDYEVEHLKARLAAHETLIGAVNRLDLDGISPRQAYEFLCALRTQLR